MRWYLLLSYIYVGGWVINPSTDITFKGQTRRETTAAFLVVSPIIFPFLVIEDLGFDIEGFNSGGNNK